MKLFLKDKPFSFSDVIIISDDIGNEKYRAQGKVFSVSRNLKVVDTTGKPVIEINERVFSFMPKFEIKVNGNIIAVISEKFRLTKQCYLVDNTDILVEGDLLSKNYIFKKGKEIFAKVSRPQDIINEKYEIDIFDDKDELLVLGLVLATYFVNTEYIYE